MTIALSPSQMIDLLAQELLRASAARAAEPYLVVDVAVEAIKRAAKAEGVPILASRAGPIVEPSRRAEATRAARDAFRRVGERDGFSCRHCGAGRNLTVDHVVAVVNGGSDEDENFQILCAPCNSRKGAR